MNLHTLERKPWILASAAGLALGIPAGLILGAPLEVAVGMILITPVMLALVGTVLGTSQWLVLRRRFSGAAIWIGLSAIGASAGLTLGIVLVEQAGRWITGSPVRMASTSTLGLLASMVVIGLLGGGVLGAVQGIFWRRANADERTKGSAIRSWSISNALGLAGGLVAGLMTATLVFGGLSGPGAVATLLAISGVVFGLVSSWSLPKIAC